METFIIMLKNVAVFVLLAVPGFLFVKCKIAKDSDTGILSKLLMYVGLPFLIITSTLKIEFNETTIKSLLLSLAIGVVYYVVLLFASKFIAGKGGTEKQKGMVRFCSIFSNNGFLGIPLAKAVFEGSTIFDGNLIMLCLVVLNIITNMLMYMFGIGMVASEKKKVSVKKIITNPVLIAFVIGLVLNLLNVDEHLSEVTTYSNHLSGLVTPVSMIIIGMKLGGIKFSSLFTNKKAYYVSFIKLICVPVVIVGILFVLRLFLPISSELIVGAFVAFAMPTAGLASTFADCNDGDTENAVIFTLGTTLFSVLTIPLLYLLLTSII